MLTTEEKAFLRYWEQHRSSQKKTFRQWLIGLPIGLLFGVPILLNYATGWYKRAGMAGSQASPAVLIIAILAIISFVAIFYKRFQWEQYEQKYRELKAKEDQEQADI